MAKRRKLSILAGVLLALGAATAVWAYFTAIGTGTGTASISTLGSPSPVTASAGAGSAHVTWSSVSSPSGTVGDVTFSVQRSFNGGVYTAADGTCVGTQPNAAPSTTLSCDDSIAATGSYVYRVIALFHTWTSSGVSSAITVVVDATPPTSSISFPSTGGFYNATTYRTGCNAGTDEICGTAADPGAGASGLNKVQVAIQRPDSLYWNGSAWASEITWNDAAGTTSWAYGFGAANLANDVTYTVQSRAVDNESNIQALPATTSFTFDSAMPAATITFPTQGAQYNAAAFTAGCAAGTNEFCGTASDPGTSPSGVSKVQVEIQRATDGKFWNASSATWVSGMVWNDAAGTSTWSYSFDPANLSTGVLHGVGVRAVDNAGNVPTFATAFKDFYYDGTPPTSTITFPVTGSFHNAASYRAGCAAGTDEICGTAADPGAGVTGVNRVEVAIQRSADAGYWNGSNWGAIAPVWNVASGTTTWSYPLSVAQLMTGVTYTVQSRATDHLGNVQTPSSTSFTYDTVAPTAPTIVRADANPTNATSLNWTVTFLEPVNNVAAGNFGLVTSGLSGTAPSITSVTPPSGASTTWTVTASTSGATASAGSIQLNLTSSGTIQDRATNALSAMVPVAGQAYTFDTTAPTAADLQAANGTGTGGRIGSGDALTFTYSEAMDPNSIKSGWNGSATSVTVTITDAGSADTLTVSFLDGTVSLGGNYVQSTRVVTATMVMSGSTITVTLTASPPSGQLNTVASGTMEWSPDLTAKDLAGNAMSSGSATESGSPADQDF